MAPLAYIPGRKIQMAQKSKMGLGAYVQPHVKAKAEWFPFYNTIRFDRRLADF